MIKLTRLNGIEFYANPHLIEFIETNPDTTICFIPSKKIVVKDALTDVLNRIICYRRNIGISISDAEVSTEVLEEGVSNEN